MLTRYDQLDLSPPAQLSMRQAGVSKDEIENTVDSEGYVVVRSGTPGMVKAKRWLNGQILEVVYRETDAAASAYVLGISSEQIARPDGASN